MNCTPDIPCAERLTKLVNAYFNVLQDGSVQEVTIGEDTTRYHKTDLAAMKNMITALHSTCGNEASAMIVGGRRRPASFCFEESHSCHRRRC